MKRIFLFLLLPFLFTACVQDEIDELTAKLDEQTTKLKELEQQVEDANAEKATQIQGLLTTIQQLTTDLTDLQENGATDQELETVLGQLTTLTALVNSESDRLDGATQDANKVYWGSVVTASDYASLALGSYKVISGDVEVSSDADAAALAGIEVVGGSLYVKGGATVELASLTTVGKDVMAAGVESLTTLTFTGLNSVGGSFDVYSNNMIETVAVSSLTYVGGDMKVEGMEGMEGVPAVTLPTGLKAVGGSLVLRHLPTVTEVTFNDITSVGGDLELASLSSVASLSFSNLMSIEGDLTVKGNAVVSTLNFDEVKMIAGKVTISDNASQGCLICWPATPGTSELTEISTFQKVETIEGGVEIMNNVALTTITGFDALTSVKDSNDMSWPGTYGAITITGNDVLENVTGFNALMTGGKIEISLIENASSLTVDAFNAVSTLYEGFFLQDVYVSVSFNALEMLNSTEALVFGGLWSPLVVSSFEGLSNLQYLSKSSSRVDTSLFANISHTGDNGMDWCVFNTVLGRLSVNGGNGWGAYGGIVLKDDGTDLDNATVYGDCNQQ